jgi:hypothetical protein
VSDVVRAGADATVLCEGALFESLRARWVQEGRARGVRVTAARFGEDSRVFSRVVSERPRRAPRVRRSLDFVCNKPFVTRDPLSCALGAYSLGSVVCVEGEHGARVEIALENSRVRAHEPVACRTGGRWMAAWLREDTGRVSLEVATVTNHTGRPAVERRRVAEVWTATHAKALAVAQPTIAPRPGGGLWIAWREERGPLAAVYLRALDADGRADGSEVRVSSRGLAADPVAPALTVDPSGRWACAFSERRAAGPTVCLARLLRAD